MIQTHTRPSPIRLSSPISRRTVVTDNNNLLIAEYLEWKKTHAARAAVVYEVWVKRFQEFANKAPEDFRIIDWTGFARSLEGRFAPKSIQFGLNVIHNYLRYWFEQGRLSQLPLFLARVPKATPNSHRSVEESEYQKMIRNLRTKNDSSVRDLLIIMLLHDTGVRVGELVGLEIEQMEEDQSAIIRTEKTNQRRRIFWNSDTHEVLQQFIAQRINASAEAEFLFVGKRSNEQSPLTTRSVQRIVSQASCEAEIKSKISPHSFRHAFIHRLAKLGVADAIIAQLVGHGTPHSIAHYTKLSRPEFQEFARKQFQAKAA